MFTVAEALAVCTANLKSRVKSSSTSYVLYFTNDQNRHEGKLIGTTIKALINEFRTSKGTYKYAFITKKDDDKVLRFYNRDVSKKFFSMTRTGKRKKI